MSVNYSFEDLRKIIKGRRHFEIFTFPDTEVQYAIKVLSQLDIEHAYTATEIKVPKQEVETSGYNTKYNQELQRQLLFRAMIQVPEYRESLGDYEINKFFPDTDVIGELLSIDMIGLLMEKYLAVQEKYSPTMSLKTEEDFLKVIDEIKKNSTLGLSLSTYEQTILLDFLVKNPDTLLKDNGSSSMPAKKLDQKKSEKPTKTPIKIVSRKINQMEEMQKND